MTTIKKNSNSFGGLRSELLFVVISIISHDGE